MIGEKASIAEKGIAVDISVTDHVVGKGVASGLYVGGSGDLVVKFEKGGADVTFVAHPAGYAPIDIYSVVKTGTTASSMVALW